MTQIYWGLPSVCSPWVWMLGKPLACIQMGGPQSWLYARVTWRAEQKKVALPTSGSLKPCYR